MRLILAILATLALAGCSANRIEVAPGATVSDGWIYGPVKARIDYSGK